MNRRFARAALWSLAVVLPLFALEAALYLHHEFVLVPRTTPPKLDPRSKSAVVDDLKRAGADAWPHITAQALFDDRTCAAPQAPPLVGAGKARTVLCNENGPWIDYAADRFGFRNPDEVWDAPADVVLVGDSFTQGWCVPDGDELGARLRETGRNVRNVGLGGAGPLVELAVLGEYGLLDAPKTVLWLYFEGNDLKDLTLESRCPALTARLSDGPFGQAAARLADPGRDRAELAALLDAKRPQGDKAQPQETQTQIGAKPKAGFLRNAAGLNYLRWYIREALKPRQAALEPAGGPLPPLLAQVFVRARSLTEAAGGRFVVVYLPRRARLISGADDLGANNRGEVLAMLKDTGVETLDFTPVALASGDPLALFPPAGRQHYGPKGYALLARTIAQFLDKPTPTPGR